MGREQKEDQRYQEPLNRGPFSIDKDGQWSSQSGALRPS